MVVLLQPHIKTFTGFPLYSSIQPLCGSMWSPSYPCFITFVYVYMDRVESTHEGKHVAFYLWDCVIPLVTYKSILYEIFI